MSEISAPGGKGHVQESAIFDMRPVHLQDHEMLHPELLPPEQRPGYVPPHPGYGHFGPYEDNGIRPIEEFNDEMDGQYPGDDYTPPTGGVLPEDYDDVYGPPDDNVDVIDVTPPGRHVPPLHPDDHVDPVFDDNGMRVQSAIDSSRRSRRYWSRKRVRPSYYY